jgi:Fe-S cluster assembly protein SufB
VIEWLNGNMGSGVTMLYPMSVLRGARARSEHVGVAFAGAGQNQDTGAKVVHLAPGTSSVIRAKSISKDGGISSYRGLVRIGGKASGAASSVACDALVVGDGSVSNTYPFMRVDTDDVVVSHEASVGRIGDDEVFALMSRGIPRAEAEKLVVRGFIDPIVKRLPLEYAVELSRLIELEMEGSIG